MPSITIYQLQQGAWLLHNFPNQQPHDALLGIVEEVGELSHAHLKIQQGIRDSTEADIRDALGDLFIYMLSYANTNEINLSDCIEEAWQSVRKRDWRKFPINGLDV